MTEIHPVSVAQARNCRSGENAMACKRPLKRSFTSRFFTESFVTAKIDWSQHATKRSPSPDSVKRSSRYAIAVIPFPLFRESDLYSETERVSEEQSMYNLHSTGRLNTTFVRCAWLRCIQTQCRVRSSRGRRRPGRTDAFRRSACRRWRTRRDGRLPAEAAIAPRESTRRQ